MSAAVSVGMAIADGGLTAANAALLVPAIASGVSTVLFGVARLVDSFKGTPHRPRHDPEPAPESPDNPGPPALHFRAAA